MIVTIIIIIIRIVYVVCMWLKCWLTYDGSGLTQFLWNLQSQGLAELLFGFQRVQKALGP